MSASPVLAAFPRRPIALVTTPKHRRGRLIGLAFCLLLFGPSLYWGVVRWNEASLRADLRERGVMAAATGDAEGSCTSYRRRLSGTETPKGCSFTVTYTLRPEEGGGERQADVWLDGRAPILTPAVWYDPQDPSRAMLRPEIDRDPSFSQWAAPFLLLILPLVGLLWWWAIGRGGLAKAAASPDPLIAPIEQATRHMPSNCLTIHFRPPGAARASVKAYGPGEEPFLVRPPADAPPDQQWVLALRSPKGRSYALDVGLRDLELTEAERSRIYEAAWA
ncbi:MAG TPA: hypothetical protein VEC11_03050 [Allosphingosinicella sp.]|nr:hypothetical protein [Allosphingosinicella sp.]